MTKAPIKFFSLNILVKDLRASIEFYQKIGFYVFDSKSTNYSVSTYLKLSDESDFVICLTQTLIDKINHKPIWIEVEPEDNAKDEVDDLYEDAFLKLIDKGISYENIKPEDEGTVICGTGIINDPDGITWHLVNNCE